MVKVVSKSETGNHLANQIIRSGTSVSLNYGEAQGAESRKDFIHKMKIILKELRETHICLRIIQQAKLYQKSDSTLSRIIAENDELISIFVRSVDTAQNRRLND